MLPMGRHPTVETVNTKHFPIIGYATVLRCSEVFGLRAISRIVAVGALRRAEQFSLEISIASPPIGPAACGNPPPIRASRDHLEKEAP